MILELFIFTLVVYTLVTLFSPGRRLKGKNLPPGPYPLPIIGNVHQLAVRCIGSYPHKAMTELGKEYGELTSFWLGEQYMILLSSHSAIKELLSMPQTTLSRYIMPYIQARAFGKTNLGIIWNHDESWQEMRRFAVRTLKDFGFGKKQGIEYVIHEEIKEFIESIKETRDSSTNMWELDRHAVTTATLNMVWNYVAGFRIPKTDPRLDMALDYGEAVTKAVGPTNRYSAFPWAATWFPKLSLYDQHCEEFKKSSDVLFDMVEDVRKARGENSNQEPTTLLELFLHEIEKHKGEKDTLYTDEQLNVILQDFFLAGVETTATALSWMILYIAINPEVQKKVYQEVVEVMGTDGVTALSMEPQLIYSKATILESMRFSCFIPSIPPRYCTEAISYKGYTIPKGTGLIPNFDAIFHSKEVWGDPDNFRPERFISTNDDGTRKIINADKVPAFGFGRRICPGESVASAAMLFMLTTIIQKMELSVVPGKEPPLLPRNAETITMVPQQYFVKITDRN